MTEQKKNSEVVEASVVYTLGAVAALLAFILGWLICVVAGSLSSLT